tara:strand:- start:5680 stop:5865 length:186 start_codon:yes stop_codon:yes gene_type:complete
MTEIQKFNQILNQCKPDAHLTQQEAVDAHHNLSGFMSLLIKINEREQVVQTKPHRKQSHEN